MYIIMNERDAGKKHMIITILNSMSASERKEFLNKIYGMYVDTDSIKVYNHCEELLYKIREVDNATEKTFKKVYNEIKNLNIDCGAVKYEIDEMKSKINEWYEIDSARIDAQAETIQKLCKVIKFMLPYLNINPFSKKHDEDIRKTLEDIYKEI